MEQAPLFACESTRAAWHAVKNGLYKAALLRENHIVLDESCSRLAALLEQEMETARKILARAEPARLLCAENFPGAVAQKRPCVL